MLKIYFSLITGISDRFDSFIASTASAHVLVGSKVSNGCKLSADTGSCHHLWYSQDVIHTYTSTFKHHTHGNFHEYSIEWHTVQ